MHRRLNGDTPMYPQYVRRRTSNVPQAVFVHPEPFHAAVCLEKRPNTEKIAVLKLHKILDTTQFIQHIAFFLLS